MSHLDGVRHSSPRVSGHANRHPTSFVLLEPDAAVGLLDALHRLLEQHQLAVGEALGPRDVAGAVAMVPRPAAVAHLIDRRRHGHHGHLRRALAVGVLRLSVHDVGLLLLRVGRRGVRRARRVCVVGCAGGVRGYRAGGGYVADDAGGCRVDELDGLLLLGRGRVHDHRSRSGRLCVGRLWGRSKGDLRLWWRRTWVDHNLFMAFLDDVSR